jgi:hypothetical protein
MRKLVTWIVVTLGIAALVRKLRRRSDVDAAQTYRPETYRPEPGAAESSAPPPAATSESAVAEAEVPEATAPESELRAPAEEDPAEELRRKLADTRDEEASPPGDATIEERRSEVHEQGRAAIDDMHRSTED